MSTAGEEPVTHPALGGNVARLAGVNLYFLSQAVDVHPQRVLEDLFQGPETAEHEIRGGHSASIAHEDVE
jgi:hypothetical protein